MLTGFFMINACLVALYAMSKGKRGEKCGLAVFFFFLPGLGFLLYFLPQLCFAPRIMRLPRLLRFFLQKKEVDRKAILTHAFEIERQPEHPDVKEALNVVPVEDAMAVSGNTEKRSLLLRQLKKDLLENYKIILTAEQDEDSESAHYVAAAKMEVYRLQQKRWLDCRADYEHAHENAETYHAACAALADMLDSGVLSAKEQNAYQRRFCDLVQERIGMEEGEVSPTEYKGYLKCLVELEHYEEAERLWQEKSDRMNIESAYRTMLQMFYQVGEREKFENCLEKLRKNRRVRLSPEGLEQLRYWTRRLSEAVV